MQPTIKALFARHNQRKHDSAAEPALARGGLGRSSKPPRAPSEKAERAELSAAADLARAEVASPPGVCPGGAAGAAAEPSTAASSSGELRPKKRARAFDYFLVRLPAHLSKEHLEQQVLASLRRRTVLMLSLCRCWTARRPATKARTW